MGEIKKRIETKWTERGYRVVVQHQPGLLTVTCQARSANFTADESSTWVIFDIGFPNASRLPEMQDITAHCLSVVRDEQLEKDAVQAIRDVFSALKETVSEAPRRSTPPGAN